MDLFRSSRYHQRARIGFLGKSVGMPKITFIENSGARHEVTVDAGISLMEAAVKNSVPGIDADCGGACACATCHVILTPEWREKLGAPSDMEASMLDFANEVTPTSRLSCQIPVTDDMDGIEVTMPESQG